MTYDNAEDYPFGRKRRPTASIITAGRKAKQFIDDKAYKPGLEAYDKSRAGR